MCVNDIVFPKPIIDAINVRNLVVFAGAGASIGAPTSLPSFRSLVEEIANGTGESLQNEEPCEVFLGRLKAKGVPVNELAAEILSGKHREPSRLHKVIVDLFRKTDDIKIVTTNYDQMFEQVLSNCGVKATVFNAPALPLGSDINGIVHVHGNIISPKNMIMTDEDFGKAYLTEGYASKFLVNLFGTYTVLFIGYSYKDTIIKYLTRAISMHNSDKRYILTDDKDSNWTTLGITPIYFPKDEFEVIGTELEKLGVMINKSLLDWEKQFSKISTSPSEDPTDVFEIEYCLANRERSQILANNVHGKNWISFLDKKGMFDSCFSEITKYSEQDILWTSWLCDNFIGKEDESILLLITKHDNYISKLFADIVFYSLVNNNELKNETFSKYIILIERHLIDSWRISLLVKHLLKRDLSLLGFHLFKKLFDIKLTLERSWNTEEPLEYKHTFDDKSITIRLFWDKIKERICKELAYTAMSFAHNKIEEVHNLYVFANRASEDSEPLTMATLVIEDRENSCFEYDILQVLAQIYSDAAVALKEQNAGLLKGILLHHLDSKSILIKKLTLKTIRTSGLFSAREALNILFTRNYIENKYLKEQVFLLVADILEELDEQEINALIDRIVALGQDTEDQNKLYSVYNWGVWLQRIDDGNARVNELVTYYHSKYRFESCKHPEMDDGSSPDDWEFSEIVLMSPLTEKELKERTPYDAANYMKNYKTNSLDRPSRDGLLVVLKSCVSKDYLWAKSIVRALIVQKVNDEDIWNHIFEGFDDVNISLKDRVELLEYLAAHVSEVRYDKQLAILLNNSLNQDDVKASFPELENRLYSVSESVWNNRNRNEVKYDRPVDSMIKTTTGIIIDSWIHMISNWKGDTIPDRYKNDFEQALKLSSWEKNVSACVLARYFSFLCYRDKEWCNNYLKPLLASNDDEVFFSAWNGMIFASSEINKDTANIIAQVLLEAIKRIDLLDDETRRRFIELLLSLLIYIVDNPTLKYIPEFYNHASEEDVTQFIVAIGNKLRKMDVLEKQKWWGSWLKSFLENRKNSKPLPVSEIENRSILNLLTELEFVFGEAVKVISKGSLPNVVDEMFWFFYSERKLARKYPHETVFILTKILNSASIPDYDKIYISEIVKEINGIDKKEQKQLQASLLKKNIVIEWDV